MTITPIRPDMPQQHPDDKADGLARAYIQQLMQGTMPQQRPEPADFGRWSDTVESLEIAFGQVPHPQDQAAEHMIQAVEMLCRFNKELARLMTPAPTLDDIVDDEDEQLMPALPRECQFPYEFAFAPDVFPWMDDYVEYSMLVSPEGYDEYHWATGMHVLSTASARRVYVQLGDTKFYGNLLLALCGETGAYAKSTTANVGNKLLSLAGLSHLLAPDKISPAKLLSDMSGSRLPADFSLLTPKEQERWRTRLAMSGQKSLYIDELGVFIQAMSRKNSTTSDFMELMLTFDNAKDMYEMSTVARSSEPIQYPYLPVLGAMTPSNLKENAQSGSELWGNGFWGRWGFIVPPKGGYKDCPFQREKLFMPESLIDPIRQWHVHLGIPNCEITERKDKDGKATGSFLIERDELPQVEIEMDDGAYDAWVRYRTALKRMFPEFPDNDLNGNYIRFSTIALRMALLIAALQGKHITLKHWARAQYYAEIIRKGAHELYRQVNSNDYVSEAAKLEKGIIERLQKNKKKGVDGITAAQLKSRYYKTTSMKMLNDVLDNLTKGGILHREPTPQAKAGKFFLVE